MWVRCGTVWHGVWCDTVCDIVCWYGLCTIWKITVCGMLVVRYDGTLWWMYYLYTRYMLNIAWWCGMFQYIRSVRVEYVVRISSVTTSYIGHWNVLF